MVGLAGIKIATTGHVQRAAGTYLAPGRPVHIYVLDIKRYNIITSF